jgi:pimeloyl-[acyl-carrier protein] methyl ester esterase
MTTQREERAQGVSVATAPLHVDVIGEGPDLVLVHGWAMHGGIFAPWLDELGRVFRVHVVDLPGHGRARDEDRLDVHAFAKRLAAAMPQAIWVGWSLGGLVALHAAIECPERVRGLCAVASTPRFVSGPDWAYGVPAEVFSEFARDLHARYREAIERFLALETLGSPHAQEELRMLRATVFARGEPALSALEDGLAALSHADLRDHVPRLRMPSLWIAGRRDRIVPPAALRWGAATAPRSAFLELNSGHAPFLDEPGTLARALAAFAAELAT